MPKKAQIFSKRQLIFKELFVGALIYAVVLGFFNDYTSIVYAKSFSTIFFASFVLEVLTYLAFLLKSKIIAMLKDRIGIIYRVATFFFVWLIMFVSKFVFVWVVDGVFGQDITIVGFFGILIIVVCVTIVHKLADLIFEKLGNNPLPKTN